VNLFEYPGIHLVWSLAHKNPDKIYLYFHSKGMSRGQNNRGSYDKKIFQSVIVPWKKVLNIFDERKTIHKIGISVSAHGWIWFNFWWVRGSYLIECVEPIIAPKQYYEDWLHMKLDGQAKSNINECFSLPENKSGIFDHPLQALRKVASMVLQN
jgi:hypothetical protein